VDDKVKKGGGMGGVPLKLFFTESLEAPFLFFPTFFLLSIIYINNSNMIKMCRDIFKI
jgi:hypothetical protein